MNLFRPAALVMFISMLASLHSMQLSNEKFSMYLDSPITSWKDNSSLFGFAYQGATYVYNKDEPSLEIQLLPKETQQCIHDWIFAVKQVEKELLTKPFQEWTLKDIEQISTWLTKSSCEHPGVFRTDIVKWRLRTLKPGESEQLNLLITRKLLSSKISSSLAHTPLNAPLTPQEETYLNNSFYIFPFGESLQKDLSTALCAAQEQARKISKLPWEERQSAALTLGCSFHIDIVRIHPYTEGAKRLGRLCMYIIHAQHGIRPQAETSRIY